MIRGPLHWKPSARHIMVRDFVAQCCGMKPDAIMSKSRVKAVTRTRQLTMWVLRNTFPDLSHPCIAVILGGMDHTSIISGVRKTAARMDTDPEFRELGQTILNELHESGAVDPGPYLGRAARHLITHATANLKQAFQREYGAADAETSDDDTSDEDAPDDRTWCDQCQRRVTTTESARCSDNHCTIQNALTQVVA